MNDSCYVTVGQRYRHETHPVDERAHPDGWFEYQAHPGADASDAARRHLLGDDGFGRKVPLFAFDYDDQPDHGMYPRGCLARFDVHPDGAVTEATA